MLQILSFWTLSIVLLLSKSTVLFIFQNNFLETGFCLRPEIGLALSIGSKNRFYLQMETESSLGKVVFWNTNRAVFLIKQDDGKCPET
jgi:hypothetical protein